MTTVWLGRGVSNNVALIEALSQKGCSVVLSHNAERWAGQQHAPSFREPDCSGVEYVQWCADMVKTYGFDYFMPGRCLGDFATANEDLKRKLVMGCAPERSNDLDDKALFYQQCQDAQLTCAADFAVFSDLNSFQSGMKRLNKQGHERLCFKPRKGVFGQGFRALTNASPLDTIVYGSSLALRASDFERWLAEASSPMADMILMPLFDGKEISVDGAFDGTHYRMVARVKNGTAGQRVVTTPEIYQIAENIARVFELRGIFNIQLMYHNNQPMVLEVNPRAAGGFGISCLADVDLFVAEVLSAPHQPAQGVIVPQREMDIVSHTHYAERRAD